VESSYKAATDALGHSNEFCRIIHILNVQWHTGLTNVVKYLKCN